MARGNEKAELIAELDRARTQATHSLRGVGRSLDVTHRLASSVSHHRTAWFTGAAVIGFLFARIPLRRRTAPVPKRRAKAAAHDAEQKAVKAGILVTALKLAFDIARPALTKWATRRVASYAQHRFGSDRSA